MTEAIRPLADRMRPQTIQDIVGQDHLLGDNQPLRLAIESGQPHSMILWGPPGTGKTTLARAVANHSNALFLSLSAVLGGVKEVRAAIEHAQQHQQAYNEQSILFIDEVHRFNKAQQDAFLPFVEDGTVTFIGATTENPSFEVNNALLSRARTYVLRPLEQVAIEQLLQRAMSDAEVGLGAAKFGASKLTLSDAAAAMIAVSADGDARRALTYLDIAAELAGARQQTVLDETLLSEVLAGDTLRRFDKGGDDFYDQISALHKAVRGTDPDAALYWLCRMLDGGCDPLYIARRVVRMASEDIGNADPRGLQVALNAWETYERLGSPEGELTIAQAVVYLAVAPKSNAAYVAYKAAMADVKQTGSLPVPDHLRNAPTQLMKDMGYGKDYRYAHDEQEAYAAGEQYFPDELEPRNYYQPVPRGLEIKIAEKLQRLKRKT